MNAIRRNVLKGAGGLGALSVAAAAGLLMPTRVLAEWNHAAFGARQKEAALSAIGGANAETSDKITVRVPDIAENGAVVPVEISVNLPGLESIAILSEKNVNPLVAYYRLTDTDGYLNTRIKMGETGKVRAIVKAGGKSYTAAREVKVTVGGCGGG
jgi:sulfur-oxidizing protein SoxY